MNDDTGLAVMRAAADRLLTLPYEAWNFGDSVAFEGLIAASDVLGDERYVKFAHGFMRGWAARRTPFRRLDATAAGSAMVDVATRTGDQLLIEALVELSDYLRARPTLYGVYETWEHSPLVRPYGPTQLQPKEAALLATPPPGVFLDCLHFDPPFLVALGGLIGDDDLVADGVDQAVGYIEVLQTDEGLFDHFVLRDVAGRFGPGWGRGQGWALLGLLDVIDVVSSEHPQAPVLRTSARRLIEAMLTWQQPDGHWPSVVNRPDSVPEASTAAFMGAGFLRAHAEGIVGGGALEGGLRAVNAAAEAASSGALAPVSAAVMACTEAEHYCHVPTGFVVPWGEGPLVLALAARERGRAR